VTIARVEETVVLYYIFYRCNIIVKRVKVKRKNKTDWVRMRVFGYGITMHNIILYSIVAQLRLGGDGCARHVM